MNQGASAKGFQLWQTLSACESNGWHSLSPAIPDTIVIEARRRDPPEHLMCLIAKWANHFVNLDKIVSLHHRERINPRIDLAPFSSQGAPSIAA